MAEISPINNQQKAGVAKGKKQSLRVDLTPMVDLGFLLISFFVFTTTISQPTSMKLALPDDRNIIDSSKIPAGKTLNLILSEGDNVYAYNGDEPNNINALGSNRTALRNAIFEKKNDLKNRFGSDSGLIVLLKPTNTSTYANVVNALDEMLICNVKTYVLMDANETELKAIEQ